MLRLATDELWEWLDRETRGRNFCFSALNHWYCFYKLVMKYGPSDPRDMRVMKHFAKTMAPRTVNG
jgi:hypothetical protein